MSTVQVKYLIETHGEDDVEIADYNITGAYDEDFADELDEIDPAWIVGVNPETKMINTITEGVHEYICDVDTGTMEHIVISSHLLSNHEISAIFNSLDFPDAF